MVRNMAQRNPTIPVIVSCIVRKSVSWELILTC